MPAVASAPALQCVSIARAVGNERRAVLADRAGTSRDPRREFASPRRATTSRNSARVRRLRCATASIRSTRPARDSPRSAARSRMRSCAPRTALQRVVRESARVRRAPSDHPHRAGDADRRRAAHGERRDRVADVVDRAQVAVHLARRQRALIEDAHAAAVVRPADGLNDVACDET